MPAKFENSVLSASMNHLHSGLTGAGTANLQHMLQVAQPASVWHAVDQEKDRQHTVERTGNKK